MSLFKSESRTEIKLRLNPNVSIRWTKTKAGYPQPGIYNLMVDYSYLDNQISCFLGDYPNKKGWQKKIIEDIREAANVLEIKIPTKLSLQTVKI